MQNKLAESSRSATVPFQSILPLMAFDITWGQFTHIAGDHSGSCDWLNLLGQKQ